MVVVTNWSWTMMMAHRWAALRRLLQRAGWVLLSAMLLVVQGVVVMEPTRAVVVVVDVVASQMLLLLMRCICFCNRCSQTF